MHHVIINKSKKPISKKYTPEIANIWKKLKINKQKM
jgi:CxxC motif-containing protein